MSADLSAVSLVYSHGELAAALGLSDRQLQTRLAGLYQAHFPRPIPMLSPARWSRAPVQAWIDAAGGDEYGED